MKYFFVCIVLVFGAFSRASMRAQTAARQPESPGLASSELVSYEGQNVSGIELAGRPDLSSEQFQTLFVQKTGQPFSAEKVTQTIAALKRTNEFQDVTVDLRPEPSGVRVIFIAQPALYFGTYEFQGTDEFPYARLLQVTNYSSAEPYNDADVRAAEDNLRTFLARNGYFEASIESKNQTETAGQLVNVSFSIHLNRRAEFGDVHIEGASTDDTARLQSSLKSWHAIVFGAAVRQGKKYSLKTLEKATTHLESRLAKDNRLEAHVKLIGAEYHSETNRADVTFNVQPGPVVDVRLEGIHLWPWTKHKLLPMYQQAGLEPDLIQEGRRNLLAHLNSKGYFDATVDAQVLPEEGREKVLYRVSQGPRKKIAGIQFTGNHHFDGDELETHVSVEKARLFSAGKYNDSSVKTLSAFYQTKGFNQVRVSRQFVEHEGKITVTFAVDEGPQDTVASFNMRGNNTVTLRMLAPDGIGIAPGQPYSQKTIDDDRNKLMASYLEMGYLTVTFHATATAAAGDPHKFDVEYEVTEGPQVLTSSVFTAGRNVTQQALINKEVRQIHEGQPLSQRELMSSESRLYSTGVFDWAEVTPLHQIASQQQDDVIIRLHEAKRNSLVYGFGIESTSLGGTVPSGTVAVPGLPPVGLPSTFKTSQRNVFGPRFDFLYTRSNVRGKAESLSFSGLLAPLDRRGSINFMDPNLRWTDWNATASFSGDYNKENPIFTMRQGLASFQLRRTLDLQRTENLILQYSASQTRLIDLLIPGLVPHEDLSTRLSTLSATLTRDKRDNILDAHKGTYSSLELDLNPNVLGSNVNFGRFLAQVAAYRDIHSGMIWANSVRIGLEEASSGSHVPISQRFFTGGGSTLRGFPLNGAGPQATVPACGNPSDTTTCGFITVPTGGRQLFIVNSELRIPIPIKKNLGFAMFYDGGNAYDRVGFKDFVRDYTNSVGVGLRYNTPVGPVRVDIGHNLSPIPGIKATQIFITLGQAF